MINNGTQGYRANFDNRNKIIWNNTHFRLFDRNNPNSLDVLPIADIVQKSVKSKARWNEFHKILPEEDPEVREKFIADQ